LPAVGEAFALPTGCRRFATKAGIIPYVPNLPSITTAVALNKHRDLPAHAQGLAAALRRRR